MDWIRTADNPPPLGQRVLLRSPGGFVGEGYRGKDQIYYRPSGIRWAAVCGFEPTKWMELPD